MWVASYSSEWVIVIGIDHISTISADCIEYERQDHIITHAQHGNLQAHKGLKG